MTYGKVKKGIFQARPNRFIAHVDFGSGTEICHVKNTGRCRELLLPGATVYAEDCQSPARKTRYDLIAVEKGPLLINMDSQAPNKAARDYLPKLFPGATDIRPETTFGDSRFDFFLKTPQKDWFVEVKGVTLEENGHAYFPDAPTQRGVKHLLQLQRCLAAGFGACVLFVVQMKGVTAFHPNDETHPLFGQVLRESAQKGVLLHAADCLVTPCSMQLDKEISILLTE